jgi:DNA-directed RNA polymerase specialized sigma24 family protein
MPKEENTEILEGMVESLWANSRVQDLLDNLGHKSRAVRKQAIEILTAYIKTCARNKAIAYYESHKATADIELDAYEVEELLAALESEREHLEYMEDESALYVSECRASLTPKQQAIFDRLLEGYTARDIASELHMSLRDVCNIRAQVKAKVAQFVEL